MLHPITKILGQNAKYDEKQTFIVPIGCTLNNIDSEPTSTLTTKEGFLLSLFQSWANMTRYLCYHGNKLWTPLQGVSVCQAVCLHTK